jgi:ribosomal protein S7
VGGAKENDDDEGEQQTSKATKTAQQRAKRQRVDKSDFAEAMGNLLPRTGLVRKRGASQQSAQEIERRRRQKEASQRLYLQPKQAFDLPHVRSTLSSPSSAAHSPHSSIADDDGR